MNRSKIGPRDSARLPPYLRGLIWFFGAMHLLFGVAGLAFPRWFFRSVPPWPPLHVGQIQIGGVFDLALAVLFLGATRDFDRYGPLVVAVGAVAECGHGLVRLGHILAGDDPMADLVPPVAMLLFGLVLLAIGVRSTLFSTPRRD